MQIILYCLIPVISAFIGWITNYFAVKMIFRPRREINILGLRIIGLIPKRKMDLAAKIAQTVETELISHRDIRAIIQTEEFHLQIGSVIKKKIDSLIQSRMASNPLISMFITPEIIAKLSDTLMDELNKEIPGVIDTLFQNVESRINFQNIIKKKIEGFDLIKLESIIYSIASKELKAIEIFGGVLGFLVGLVQLIIVSVGGLNG
jgi:uncharacterized membrane protein YheB (UPF0754 family)